MSDAEVGYLLRREALYVAVLAKLANALSYIVRTLDPGPARARAGAMVYAAASEVERARLGIA